MKRHVAIIGPRGAGKSTIGRLLAAQWGLPLVDLDVDALALTGVASIREVFASSGEAAWRQAEAMALENALAGPPAVIATGGGVPCVDPPRHVLAAARAADVLQVVLLKCSAEVLRKRLEASTGDRPPLMGQDPVGEIEDVLAQRSHAYQEAADLEVNGDLAPPEVVASVLDQIGAA